MKVLESGLRQEVSDALISANRRLNVNTGRTLENSAFLFALIELLAAHQVIDTEELDKRKAVIAARLDEQYKSTGQGIFVQEPEVDKYSLQDTVAIDCASKLEFCRAACCRLPFALSRQDVRERIVHWSFSQPYMIAQGADHYCVHLDGEKRCCTIHEQRPVPCRSYDCREDKRIWDDFESNTINTNILREGWPQPVQDSPGNPA